jgi:hypothetical protein
MFAWVGRGASYAATPLRVRYLFLDEVASRSPTRSAAGRRWPWLLGRLG